MFILWGYSVSVPSRQSWLHHWREGGEEKDGRKEPVVKTSGTYLILTMAIKWMSVYMHGWLYSSALTGEGCLKSILDGGVMEMPFKEHATFPSLHIIIRQT